MKDNIRIETYHKNGLYGVEIFVGTIKIHSVASIYYNPKIAIEHAALWLRSNKPH